MLGEYFPPLSAAKLEAATIDNYEARLESYLAKFTDLFQAYFPHNPI